MVTRARSKQFEQHICELIVALVSGDICIDQVQFVVNSDLSLQGDKWRDFVQPADDQIQEFYTRILPLRIVMFWRDCNMHEVVLVNIQLSS